MDFNDLIFMNIHYCNGATSPTNPDILAIGLVKSFINDNNIRIGSELYLEIEPTIKIDEWVRSNIIPHLKGEFVPIDIAKNIIVDFCKSLGPKTYVISDTSHFNWTALCNLFGVINVPFRYPPLSFETLLWSYKIDHAIDRYLLAANLGINVKHLNPKYCLDNAKVLMSIYYSLQTLQNEQG